MVYNAHWLRPKTSQGISHQGNTNNINATDSSSIRPADASSSPSFSSATAPAHTSILASTPSLAGRRPSDNAPTRALNTRRSTQEFFHSARDGFITRPRPSSSYLLSSLGGDRQNDSFNGHEGQARRHRFKAGIEETKGLFSSMARRAMHRGGAGDMMDRPRPIGRLSTHDSTLDTVIASGSGSGSGSGSSSSNVSEGRGLMQIESEASSSNSISATEFLPQSQPPTNLPTYPSARPHSRSISRLKSLRNKATNSRLFQRGSLRDGPFVSTSNADAIEVVNAARAGTLPTLDDINHDVVMGGTHAQHGSTVNWSTQGSAARAAAAEHNTQHHIGGGYSAPPHGDGDHDEDMSDDTHVIARKRRNTGKSKFLRGGQGSDELGSTGGDQGYDSMELDVGMDEVTDTRRRSRPPVRKDIIGLLPTEIAADILAYLDSQSLLRSAKVNWKWNALATSNAVWRDSFLGLYARESGNVLPYIQFGGQGLGKPSLGNQEWRKMARARRAIAKNWKEAQPKAIYYVGHTDSVYCCQFDEKKIITGSRDRTIRVWDLHYPYKCRRVIGGPAAKPVRTATEVQLDTHPTNTVHQNASLNGTKAGDDLYFTPSDFHTASILCLQFDHEIMVTGSSDHSCIVWDVNTFEPIRRLRHHTAGVLDVCMDDEYIISCSKDAHICIWSRKDFSLIKAIHGHRGPVNAVQLREINGDKLLVSASGDGLAKIWDLKRLEVRTQFNSQDRGLAAVEFSDDGAYVLAGGNDQVIYKFATQPPHELEYTYRGHSSLVRSLFLDSANGRVVSGSYDQGIRVYDFLTGELIGSYDNWTTSWILAAKSDYRRIVATSQDGRCLVMDFGYEVPDVELLNGFDAGGKRGVELVDDCADRFRRETARTDEVMGW